MLQNGHTLKLKDYIQIPCGYHPNPILNTHILSSFGYLLVPYTALYISASSNSRAHTLPIHISPSSDILSNRLTKLRIT